MLQPKNNNNILLKNSRQERKTLERPLEGSTRTQITMRGGVGAEGHVPAANTMRKTLSLLPWLQLLSLLSLASCRHSSCHPSGICDWNKNLFGNGLGVLGLKRGLHGYGILAGTDVLVYSVNTNLRSFFFFRRWGGGEKEVFWFFGSSFLSPILCSSLKCVRQTKYNYTMDSCSLSGCVMSGWASRDMSWGAFWCKPILEYPPCCILHCRLKVKVQIRDVWSAFKGTE